MIVYPEAALRHGLGCESSGKKEGFYYYRCLREGEKRSELTTKENYERVLSLLSTLAGSYTSIQMVIHYSMCLPKGVPAVWHVLF
jgi:hypothetical protein